MRFYYLDALRSSLMMLGVLYHAALIYSRIKWRISDTGDTRFFDALIDFNQSFRMPAFFIIAGFFTQLSLRRHGAAQFLKTRAMRILIPLFVSLFTINAFMNFIVPYVAYDRLQPVWPFILKLPASFAAGLLNGHLWFLFYLYLYYLVYLALRSAASPFLAADRPEAPAAEPLRPRLDPTLLVLPLALINVAMYIFEVNYKKIYFMKVLNTFEVYRTIWMFVYFLFGIWIYKSKTMYDAFCRLRWWHVAACLVAALMLRKGVKIYFEFKVYCRGIVTWTLCIFFFSTFKRWLDRPSRLWAYLSDASYTIYLFHMIFVLCFGALMKQFPITPYLKFPIVVAATFACTLLIHHFIILRFRLFRLLYNGKWPKPKNNEADPGAPAAAPKPPALEAPAKGLP